MAVSLSGIVESAKAAEEGLQKKIKGITNSGHTAPKDYNTAWGNDNRFTGMPVCKSGDTICPYGSGNKYFAKGEIFLGPPGSGGLDIIYSGQQVVICSLGKIGTPDSEQLPKGIDYVAG